MRWLADECISPFLVAQLRDAGHDVQYMAEIAPGISDDGVVERANQDRRLLLTEDKDFGELLFRKHQIAPGIVLLRIFAERPAQKWQRLEVAIARYALA